MTGRKTPYTRIGIRRMKCVRCGRQASQQWQVCADGNTYRPLCTKCDIELNQMVLLWAGFSPAEVQHKMREYRLKLEQANNGREDDTVDEKMLTVGKHRPTHEELKQAAQPLLDLLYQYYHPHAAIVVTQAYVEVFEADMCAPLPLRD